ncbi:MAG: hypothetical protein V1921_00500 [Candidatus Altiarchaeota archaeon]
MALKEKGEVMDAGLLPKSKTLQKIPQNPLRFYLISAGNTKDFGEIEDSLNSEIENAVTAGKRVVYMEDVHEFPMLEHTKKPMLGRIVGSPRQRKKFKNINSLFPRGLS